MSNLLLDEFSLYHHQTNDSSHINNVSGAMTMTQQQQQTQELQALIRVYDSTGGSSSWLDTSGWLTDGVPHCDYFGVTCNDDQFVTALELSHNHLQGILTASVLGSQLPFLERMDVSGNLGLKVDFVEQSLHYYYPNNESSNLQFLNISHTNTTTLDGIGGNSWLEQLQILDISWTQIQIQQLLQELNQLSGLVELHMDSVELLTTELQDILEDANWPDLQVWSASNASLSGQIPPQISSSLSSLLYLDMSNNLLSGSLPDTLFSAIDMTGIPIHLNLGNNVLEGAIPETLSRLDDVFLDLTNNRITELDATFCLKSDWMNGLVQDFGCDAILCSPGTFNKFGRQISSETPCQSCDEALYYGSTSCPLAAIAAQEAPGDNNHIYNAIENDVSTFTSPRDSLGMFYRSTGGDDWHQAGNWTDDNIDICNWYGVVCDVNNTGVVRELILPRNNLQGTIPALLFQHLSDLYKLAVDDNPNLVVEFSGLEWWAPNLREISLSNTSTASLEGIANAPNMEHFNCQSTQITPETFMQVFSLKQLETLNIGNNTLDKPLPVSFTELTNLVSLRASGSGFTGPIPSELRELTNLVVLDLSSNYLQGPLPDNALNELVQLRVLDLHGQPTLAGPLPALDELSSLLQLNLRDCQLEGPIPRNFLSGINNKFLNMDIDLRGNSLTGALPVELAFFQSLNLDVTDNQISGVPEVICIKDSWMNGLIGVYGCDALLCPPGNYNPYGRMISPSSQCRRCLSERQSFYGSTECADSQQEEEEEGTVADGIAPTRSPLRHSQRNILEVFYRETGGPTSWFRSDNWMNESKDICEWYGVVCDVDFQVRSLVLSDNGLQGTSPAELFQLGYLERLFLDGNEQLTVDLSGIGSIEEPNLRTLVVSNTNTNFATGISRASSLQVLDLSATKITNETLGEILALYNLQSLNIGNTQLNTSIPSTIGGLTALRELMASGAGITGTIPESMGQLTNLASLDLSRNNLVGYIPSSLEYLTNLRDLDLHGQNSMSGGGIRGLLPPFSLLLSLIRIDLSMNEISGPLPNAFLSGLTNKAATLSIHLAHNAITGSIPTEFTAFSDLYIDLAGNNISSLSDSICSQESWMNRTVSTFGCDAILCPPLSFNNQGRQISESEPCIPCESDPSPYFGSISCLENSSESTNIPPTQRPNTTSGSVLTTCPDGNSCGNGGQCVEDGPNSGTYLCECNDYTTNRRPFAGSQCQYPATSLCSLEPPYKSFCTNQGSCTELVEPASEHIACTCPVGYQGEFCEIISSAESNAAVAERDQDGVSVGWPMVLFIALPILAIFILIVFAILRKKRRNVSYVNVDRDRDSKDQDLERGVENNPTATEGGAFIDQRYSAAGVPDEFDNASTDTSAYISATTLAKEQVNTTNGKHSNHALAAVGGRSDDPTWIGCIDEPLNDDGEAETVRTLSPVEKVPSEESGVTNNVVRSMGLEDVTSDAPASEASCGVNTADAVTRSVNSVGDETLSTIPQDGNRTNFSKPANAMVDTEDASYNVSCNDSNFIGDIEDASYNVSCNDSNYIGDIDDATTLVDTAAAGTSMMPEDNLQYNVLEDETDEDSILDETDAIGGRSLLSGSVQQDGEESIISVVENSVGLFEDSERSAVSVSRGRDRIQFTIAPTVAQSMFRVTETSETSSGELSLNF